VCVCVCADVLGRANTSSILAFSNHFYDGSVSRVMLSPESTHEDLRAFERRLTEVISHLQPICRRWRLVLALVVISTLVGAYNWLCDPQTYTMSFFDSLLRHPTFFVSILSMCALLLAGIHKRVLLPMIVSTRCRSVLADYNMTCDDTGKLILKPRPNA